MPILTQAEERALIELAQKDENSFTELYNYYFPRVNNYVHYRIADFHDAEDITSLIFEKVFLKYSYYQLEKAPFSSWLFRIARNTITDYYRSQKQILLVSQEQTEILVDARPDPIDVVVFNDTQRFLLRALASLSQREQDIIALKFWSGLSNREIAKLLGISESNTGVILYRAMRHLRTLLESQGV